MHHTLIARWILAAALCIDAVANLAAASNVAPIPTPQFRSYGLREGLPSSHVEAVVQDARGFVWVATGVGLSRFDGVEFIVPRLGVDRQKALLPGALSTLFVDRDDRLWMGGDEVGLARYDPASGDFVQWHTAAAGGAVDAIAQTRDGSVWAGSANGLFRLRDGKGGLEHVSLGTPDASVAALYVSSDGRLWVGGDAGLHVVDAEGRVTAMAFDDGLPTRVLGIAGRQTDVGIATDRGLFRVTQDGVLRRDRRVGVAPLNASLADSHGTLWLAGPQGLSMLDRFGRLHEVAGSWTALGGLPGRTVRGLFEDREHGLWFALSDGGLAYLGPSWDDFTRFAHVATDPHSFPGRAVTAVAARDGGGLWVGGLRGWIRGFDPATGRASPGYELGPPRIQALLALPGDRLLIGTVEGLTLGERGAARPIHRGIVSHPVTTMVTGDDGTVFVASLGAGLFALDPALRRARSIPFATTPQGWADTRQIEIVNGELWQASLAGLARHDPATGQMHFIEGVTPGRVNAVEPDDDGFWIVRPDSLEHFRWQGKRAVRDRHVGGSDGFPSPDILNLQRDRAGRLWLYGSTGVWRFDPRKQGFRSFGLADGLASGEFTNAKTVLLADGSMYGATLGGLVGFRPDRQSDHARRPTIAVLGATVLRAEGREALPLADGTLHLGWNDRELRVDARVLSFVSPDCNHLRFDLRHGDDVTVLRTGKHGERSFDALAPGEYTLAISGAGRDNASPALPTSLRLTVDAPPWQRWWAWTIYVSLCVALATLIVRGTRRRVRQSMRVRLAEHQQRMAEEASAAKTDFMATLGHEIRTPMTGVLGMAELLARTPLNDVQRGYVDAVRRSGSTLLRLVNDALDITRIESRRLILESECVCPRSLADEVVALAAANAREKGLELTARVDDAVPRAIRGDAIRLRQILQNLVNNAVKFTATGGVSLRIARDGGALVMTVDDTGPGMSAELRGRLFERFEQGVSPQRALGSGLGLAICHELVTLMGGSIAAVSEPGRGSRFAVRLPLVPCACVGTARAANTAARGSAGGRRLLLVEDDPVVSDVIVNLLRSRGNTVIAVGDGLAAMAELSRGGFDAVLLDLDLPRVDGFQVARMARRVEALSALPIIAVTARSAGDELAAVRAAGMDALVRKPMSGDDLDAVLDGVCGAASRTA